MIPFRPRPEPDDFDAQVRRPGALWLAAHPTGRPRDFWRSVQPALADAFGRLCAYSAICIEYAGEVDHFVSCDEDRALAYEWSNYRYCSDWINKKKQNLRAAQLLDPFEVEDDWLELGWPDLQLRVTERCPPGVRARAEFTIKRLGLEHGERAIRTRRAWVERHEQGKASLELLDEMAPLVARMLRARQRALTEPQAADPRAPR